MQLHQIAILINEGKTAEAKALLHEVQPHTVAERRMKSHLQGKLLYSQGAFNESIRIFEETIRSYGSHVEVLGDLASSFYAIGDFKAFDRMLKNLENEFALVHSKISKPSLIQTAENMRRLYRSLEIVKKSFPI